MSRRVGLIPFKRDTDTERQYPREFHPTRRGRSAENGDFKMSYWRLARLPGVYTLYFTGYNEMVAVGRGAMLNRICVRREIDSRIARVEDWVTSINDREGVLETQFTCQIDLESNAFFSSVRNER